MNYNEEDLCLYCKHQDNIIKIGDDFMSKCKGFYRHRIAAVCDNCIYRKEEIDSDSQCLNCINQTKKGIIIYSHFTERIEFKWTDEEIKEAKRAADERSEYDV